MDHLHFALEMGVPVANGIMIEAVNKVIGGLGVPIDRVSRLGLCGNTVQLSLFQGIEIRDLAYAGNRRPVSPWKIFAPLTCPEPRAPTLMQSKHRNWVCFHPV
jgi:hypothetical protein